MASAAHRNFAINVLQVPTAVYDQMQSNNAARREGREAAYAGKTEGANPFCPDESEHAMWAHGFTKARDEMVAFGLVV